MGLLWMAGRGRGAAAGVILSNWRACAHIGPVMISSGETISPGSLRVDTCAAFSTSSLHSSYILPLKTQTVFFPSYFFKKPSEILTYYRCLSKLIDSCWAVLTAAPNNCPTIRAPAHPHAGGACQYILRDTYE